MLIGIVLRGSAFVFRSYGSRDHARRHRCGADVRHREHRDADSAWHDYRRQSPVESVASRRATSGQASFADVFIRPGSRLFPSPSDCSRWRCSPFSPRSISRLRQRDDGLRDDFRARALIMAGVVLILAAVALALSYSAAPRVSAGVMGAPWSLPLHLCTAASAIAAIVALWRRRFAVARVAAVAQVSFILWGWAYSQYPFIIPETLTIRGAAAPTLTLRLLLVGLSVGGMILIPSLLYLFKTFAPRSS